jgi:hypothetical protein
MIDEIDRILAKLTPRERRIMENRLMTPTERRRERLARRNAELVAAAALLGGSAAGRAGRLSIIIGRYGASAWRHDRRRAEAPSHYDGTIAGCLFRAFTATGGSVPRSPSTLREILASHCSDEENAAGKNLDKSAIFSATMLSMIF